MNKYIQKIINFFKWKQSKTIDVAITERRLEEKTYDKENKIMAAQLKRQKKEFKKQTQIAHAKENNYYK